jgi:hypothetical protein
VAPSFDWKSLTRAAGLDVHDNAIEVRFADGRIQRLQVADDAAGTIRLWTVVARRAVVEQLKNPELYAWLRNRLVDLVDFRIDREGRMIGEASVATSGLAAEEWALYIRTVASASDRLEYLLTGRDSE